LLNALAPRSVAVPTAERRLQDALHRGLAAPRGMVLLVLLVSAQPNAPIHRLRVARAIMTEAARQSDDGLIELRNGDLAVLAPLTPAARVGLADALGQLFGDEAGPVTDLVSCWALDRAGDAARRYADERAAGMLPERRTQPDESRPALAAIDLLVRETAIWLPRAAAGASPSLHKLHHALAPASLASALTGMRGLGQDIFLALHQEAATQMALVRALLLESRQPVAALPRRLAADTPVRLGLGLGALASAEFAELALVWHQAGLALGADVPAVEALSDPAGFHRLDQSLPGARLALSGIDAELLDIAEPEALRPRLLKLNWSPLLADAALASRVAALLQIQGAAHIVLAGATDETAIRWGLALGVRRFQGWHVEAMLAANRRLSCAFSRECSIGQCAARAAAIAPAGRVGCQNPALLDQAVIS
jgi:hypothetical protein